MSAILDITCPNCSTPLKVPEQFAGKKVKCKACQQVLTVPAAQPPAPPAAAADHRSPAQKRHAADDDDEHGPKDYGVIKESDAPRCPHCAQELDPPDTKICMHCGYNLLDRRRHEARKVYQNTFGDWLSHLGPAILCALAAAALITGAVICWINMNDWLAGTFLELDEKDAITGKNKTLVKPWCFSLWISMVALWISYKLGKYAFKRFAFDFKPPERIKR
jgi:hypothetical protein